MTRSLIFLFSLLISGICSGQICDTIPVQKKITIKPSTDFDQRFSFIRNESVNIWGQRIGILINEKFKVGMGVYLLNDKISGKRLLVDGTPEFSISRRLEFATVYFEQFIYRRTYWELSVPIEAGLGQSRFIFYSSETSLYDHTTTKTFIPAGIGPSLSVKLPAIKHLRPLHWIGINFLAGYRYTLFQNSLNTHYDGFFWSISGAIFLDRVVDDYKTWKCSRAVSH